MAVYVDDPSPRINICRMIADTPDELYTMAEKIGLKRHYALYPGEFRREHFSLSVNLRAMAVQKGAIECSRADLVRILSRPCPHCCNGAVIVTPNPDPDKTEYGLCEVCHGDSRQ